MSRILNGLTRLYEVNLPLQNYFSLVLTMRKKVTKL